LFISGSHICGFEEFCRLEYNTVQFAKNQLTFHRNILPLSSGAKNKCSDDGWRITVRIAGYRNFHIHLRHRSARHLVAQWFRHYVTSQKVARSFLDELISFYQVT
jgi:hypothetical protein